MSENKKHTKQERREAEKNRKEERQRQKAKGKAAGKDFGNAFERFVRNAWEQFLSLLRFNITFKLGLGYAMHLLWLFFLMFLVVMGSGFYVLREVAKEAITNDGESFKAVMQQQKTLNAADLVTMAKAKNMKLYLFDAKGKQLVGTDTEVPKLIVVPKEETLDVSYYLELDPVYYKEPIRLMGGDGVTLVLKRETSQDQDKLVLLAQVTAGILGFFFLSSTGSMSKMSRKHLKSIHVMTAQVQDISAHNLGTRLNISGTKDELKDLAGTFNRMLDDIQKSYEREKQFVSDASHELRTPIAVIKGYGNLLKRWGKADPEVLEESIDAIIGESDYMQKMVEDLLFIVRHEKVHHRSDFAPVDMTDLIQDVYKETCMINQRHLINANINEAIWVNGSADQIKQAVRIFMDNAQKYTPEGGSITLTLRASKKHAIVVVEDTGVGISAEDLPHVFERFYRADKSRTRDSDNRSDGVGLGLAIASLILQRHDGKVHAESKLGQGTTMSILIPLALEEKSE